METGQKLVDAYARLVIGVAVNIQPGQPLMINGYLDTADLVRALTSAAYDAGASYVDVRYIDDHVRRILIEQAPEEALGYSPPWMIERLQTISDGDGAALLLATEPAPGFFDGVDGARIGKAQTVAYNEEWMRRQAARRLAWGIVGAPTPAWAEHVFGEPDVDRLWEAVGKAVRLDEPDPIESWRAHTARLGERARLLTERRFDAIHFRGPGTDLKVGLLPIAKWSGGASTTAWGQTYVANVPTEEVFTTPDWRRTEGTVRSTRPLVLLGTVVEGLKLTFEAGGATEVRATKGEDVIRQQVHQDERARFLGEVALVDGDSRVGKSGITFFTTLFDENATCHVALGAGFLTSIAPDAGVTEETMIDRPGRGCHRGDHDRTGREPLADPHRLHDRRPRGRRRRDHCGRHGRAGVARRRVGTHLRTSVQNEALSRRARAAQHDRGVLGRPDSAAIEAPCVLALTPPSAPRRRRVIPN